MGVAVQGTPALFSSHGVLGFCSSMRGERERNSVSHIVSFFFLIIIIYFFICGDPKMGYNNIPVSPEFKMLQEGLAQMQNNVYGAYILKAGSNLFT
jgi:hypothetical protein